MIDQLSADSTMAIRLGISYGKLQALRYEGILPSRTEERQPQVVVENYRKDVLCKICGKPVPNTRRNYCSGDCADIANRENSKIKWRRSHQKKKSPRLLSGIR